MQQHTKFTVVKHKVKYILNVNFQEYIILSAMFHFKEFDLERGEELFSDLHLPEKTFERVFSRLVHDEYVFFIDGVPKLAENVYDVFDSYDAMRGKGMKSIGQIMRNK